jgi:ubiquinone/menaquinone biosynthesis C-methylase UbiE
MNSTPTNYDEDQYDAFAGDFKAAQEGFYSETKNESREVLYELLGSDVKGKRVLDVGCGFGKDMLYLNDQGADVFGIDSSEKMLNLSDKTISRDRISVQSFEKTNFPSEHFDVLVSRYALQYATDLGDTMKEMYRILKSGGAFVFLVAHPLLGYVAKKNKDYFAQEIVEMPIFNGAIQVKEPTHTFSDYVSDFMLQNFVLVSVRESRGVEKKFPGNVVPDFIAFKFKKI